jgi:hypothetical protein
MVRGGCLSTCALGSVWGAGGGRFRSRREGRGMMGKERVVGGPWHRDRGTGQGRAGQGRAICTACMGFALCRHGGSSARGVASSSVFTGIIRSSLFSGAHRASAMNIPLADAAHYQATTGPVQCLSRYACRCELGAVIDQGFGGGGEGGGVVDPACVPRIQWSQLQSVHWQFAPIFSLRSDSVVSSAYGRRIFLAASHHTFKLGAAARMAHLPAPLFDFFFSLAGFWLLPAFRAAEVK